MGSAKFFAALGVLALVSAVVSVRADFPDPLSQPWNANLDCNGAPPGCYPLQVCTLRGGTCTSGGVHGQNGFHNPNGDGCGCQM
ncbi:MAG: hypothetical protein GC161_11570 [Planctomycetaceae bacterium]|nr:hypothetical protein [Planctomycetaceae bacterium]